MTCCPANLFSGSTLPPPPPSLCEKYNLYTYTVCKVGGRGGLWGSRPQTDTHLPVRPFTGKICLDDTFCIAFYVSYLSTGEAMRGRLRSKCTGRCTDTEIVMFTINYLCTYDLYSPVHNVLDACMSITRANGRGLGPGIREFFGLCDELIGECQLGPIKLENLPHLKETLPMTAECIL